MTATLAKIDKRISALDGGTQRHGAIMRWMRRNAPAFLPTVEELRGEDCAAWHWCNLRQARPFVEAGAISYHNRVKGAGISWERGLPVPAVAVADNAAGEGRRALLETMRRARDLGGDPTVPMGDLRAWQMPADRELLSWIDASMAAIEAGNYPAWSQSMTIHKAPRFDVRCGLHPVLTGLDGCDDNTLCEFIDKHNRRLYFLFKKDTGHLHR